MKLKFRDTSNMTSKVTTKPLSPIPHSSISSSVHLSSPLIVPSSKFNIYNKKRPLETNSKNSSFRGLSFMGISGVSELLKKAGSEFGASANRNFSEKVLKAAATKNSGLTIINDVAEFSEIPFGKKVTNILLYPVKDMPLDIANSTLSILKKIPGMEKSELLNKLVNNKTLVSRKNYVENASSVASIKQYFGVAEANKFKKGHTRFDSEVANYDCTAERTLTRVVTGIIPGFFLANDAYNLSMYMKNNKDVAKKEKKRRFNQEVARIGLTAATTFFALSLFSKSSNKSQNITAAIMSGTVLISEILGRVMAGTPVLPVGKKAAQRYAKIQGKVPKQEKDKTSKSSAENFKGYMGTQKPGILEQFAGRRAPMTQYQAPPKKGSLTLANFIKALGVLAVAGFGIEKLSSLKEVKGILKVINSKYKGLYTQDYKIAKTEFDAITAKLTKNGFEGFSKEYNQIVDKVIKEGNYTLKEKELISKGIEQFEKENPTKKADRSAIIKSLNLPEKDNSVIYLGAVKNKARYLLIHQALTFPVRFAWETLMLPYEKIAKPVLKMVKKNYNKLANGVEVEKKAKAPKSDVEMLKNSLQFLKKLGNSNKYEKEINKRIFNSFDDVTKSNFSNADLASVVRTATSTVTSGFLIADNYNMVMIDSGGTDKELAEQKAKERTIQRAVRIVYGAFLIKLFNGIFANTYNGSLLGAQAVNTLNTFMTESLERKSVGLPIGESTKENIINAEKANLRATGIKGGYFRVMSKLTGKKSLSEMHKAKEETKKAKA